MDKILHLSHTEIPYDSRIIKEIDAALSAGYDVASIGIKLNERPNSGNDNKRFNNTSLILYSKKFKYIPKIIRHILTFIEYLCKSIISAISEKPSIIHCNDTLVLPVGVLIKLIFKSKLVYDAHELESNRNGLSPLLGRLTFLVEKTLWRHIDGLIVVSPSIEKWYHDNISYKYSTVILNSPIIGKSNKSSNTYLRELYKIPEGVKIFIYVGILGCGRGVELILDAFKDKTVKSHVVFLGYGDMIGMLKKLADKYSNIHVHDAVPHDQVVPIIKSADVGLCLVENVSLSDYYCLPNKLFEYSFAGIPILASKFPDIIEVVDKYKLGRYSDLNKSSILTNIQIFQESESVSRNNVEELYALSWQAQEIKLVDFYNKLN